MRKRQEKDKRITAKTLSVWQTLGLIITVVAFSGTHMWIYQALVQRGLDSSSNVVVYVGLLGGYVLLIALLVVLFSTFMYRYSFDRPMRRLGDAARKVASGDFTVRMSPLRKDGKKDYVEVMFEDFNTMVQELASIETLKNDFTSNVSHEIKTPLAVIMNYATALKKEALTAEEREEYTDTIIMASQKLKALIENILKLNKLENQEIVPVAEPYNLGEQLRACMLSFIELIEEKEIELETDIEDDITIRCDASMLEIVWNNLISNSLKFTDSGGRICLSLKAAGESAVVTVQDTGCGMDEATGRHIFDKFYQGDTSHFKEGNGLGLALVKRIVDLLGGEISVNSRVGEGTTFTVSMDM